MGKARIGAIVTMVIAAVALSATCALAQGKPVAPGAFTADKFLPSSGCGCHSPLQQQWRASMHAKALSDPVFQVKVKQAEAAAGPAVALFCKKCHAPIGAMLNDPNGTANKVASEGVTCMFCHQVVGDTGKHANTSQLVEADLTRRAQLKDPQAPHPTAYSEFLQTAEFCGGCHNVQHPANGAHLEASYTEWKNSPYAAKGITCQQCHMSNEAGLIGPGSGTACMGGPQRDNIFKMSFVGANVGQGPADASTAMLKSAATVEVKAPEIVEAGKDASVTVTITNRGAGHYLPTGLTEVREMGLTVDAVGADGAKTRLGEEKFGTVTKDAKGNHPAEVWDTVGTYSDHRIPPKKSVTLGYTFKMPAAAKESKIVATLNYRSLPEALAKKASVDNPTTQMATGQALVFADAAAKAAGATKPGAPEKNPETNNTWIAIAAAVALLAVIALVAFVIVRSRKA